MKELFSWLKKHTIAYNIVVIALVFLGVAIASFVAMAFGTRHSARRTVPDFVGLKMTDAEYFAGRRDLQIIVNDSLHVSAYPGGVILDQLPKGGVVVKPGRKVYVTVNSMRQRMVSVPYVAGRSLRQAKNMLEIAGLEIEKLVYVDDIATNYVLEAYCDGVQLTPESSLEAEMGSGVVLNVGRQSGDIRAEVPKLIGLTLQRAKGRLWEMGLNLGKVTYDDDVDLLDKKSARVYYQSVDYGREVQLGDNIRLKLTLEEEKVERASIDADTIAKRIFAKRLTEERLADSLRNLENTTSEPVVEQSQSENIEDFFM